MNKNEDILNISKELSSDFNNKINEYRADIIGSRGNDTDLGFNTAHSPIPAADTV